MSAQISQSSEAERIKAAIERCEAKRDAVSDAASKRYYDLCLAGWRVAGEGGDGREMSILVFA